MDPKLQPSLEEIEKENQEKIENKILPVSLDPIEIPNLIQPIPKTYIPAASNEKIRVVFLFQVSCLWSSWETLWKACIEDKCFDVKIILVEKTSPDSKLHFLNQAKNFLIENDIPFIPNSAFCLKSFSPHIIFLQTPYPEMLPKEYDINALSSLGIRLAYIPYGIEIGGGSTNLKTQFNLPLHQQAWRIFARSKRHFKMFAKYCSAGSSHVVALGHPRFDWVSKLAEIKINPQLRQKISGRKVILWNPHFSVAKYGWSTFFQYYEFILDYFSKTKDLFLLVRPHPLLFTYLERNGWSSQQIEFLKSKINNLNNAYLDMSDNYHASFKISDAILTDASSFILEYFALGKPVCYLHNMEGPGLNDDKDILHYISVATSQQDIENFINSIHLGKDNYKNDRLKVIPEYTIMNDGRNGELIKDYIKNTINEFERPALGEKKIDLAHQKAEKYWTISKNTYLAPAKYYASQEKTLQDILNKIPKVNLALDVGCGDGRFTKMICKHAKFTKAIDISPQLIEQAKNQLALENVELTVESITNPNTCFSYDLISCMGVTSGLIDDEIFLRTIDFLVASCNENGYLLMKESMSLYAEQKIIQSAENSYNAVYRNVDHYLNCFLSRGCELIAEQILAEDKERSLINKMYLFQVKKLYGGEQYLNR